MAEKKIKKQRPMSETAKRKQKFAIRDYYRKKQAREQGRKNK